MADTGTATSDPCNSIKGERGKGLMCGADAIKCASNRVIPTNGAQDLHENLLSIGDAAFPGLSNQNELN